MSVCRCRRGAAQGCRWPELRPRRRLCPLRPRVAGDSCESLRVGPGQAGLHRGAWLVRSATWWFLYVPACCRGSLLQAPGGGRTRRDRQRRRRRRHSGGIGAGSDRASDGGRRASRTRHVPRPPRRRSAPHAGGSRHGRIRWRYDRESRVRQPMCETPWKSADSSTIASPTRSRRAPAKSSITHRAEAA